MFASPKLRLEADAKAAEILETPYAVSRLIQKLNDYQYFESPQVDIQYFHMFLTEPLTKIKLYRYLYWQPNIVTRTKNLLGHFPA